MTDTRTASQRRHIMQSVGTRNTGPELVVRRLLHGLGYRYTLHSAKLLGRPDIVFPARRKVIFVHGCFWHGHGCSKGKLPKSKLDYWQPKIARNKGRDERVLLSLRQQGWKPLVVWQCQVKDPSSLQGILVKFLES